MAHVRERAAGSMLVSPRSRGPARAHGTLTQSRGSPPRAWAPPLSEAGGRGPCPRAATLTAPKLSKGANAMARVEDIAPKRAGRFLDAEDRAALSGVPLQLTTIDYEPGAMFGPRWLIGAAVLATGEEVLIGLGALTGPQGAKVENVGRAAVLTKIKAAMEAGTDVDPVILYREPKYGSPWLLRSATDDELEDPLAPEWPVDPNRTEAH